LTGIPNGRIACRVKSLNFNIGVYVSIVTLSPVESTGRYQRDGEKPGDYLIGGEKTTLIRALSNSKRGDPAIGPCRKES